MSRGLGSERGADRSRGSIEGEGGGAHLRAGRLDAAAAAAAADGAPRPAAPGGEFQGG